MRTPLFLTAASVALIGLSGCSSDPAETPTNTATADDGMMNAEMAGNGNMASTTTMVGGVEMFPDKTIVDNAVNSPIHTTLVAAIKQAGLVETLSGAGPFTVFAPTDTAFAALPAGTVDGLLKPDAKPTLTKVLTYHVVPGRLTAADLAGKIKAGGGKATLTTVEGEPLTLTSDGTTITITGVGGSKATVNQADVLQSNGVIHVVDGVLLPKM
ncbi:fasciclin domain-containing protein [Sphingorhabdus soli]|uniref:Fasciclin domain-containing protein n=1 Tax=Flavisphingopyxis soli TaxID=2601267 RepID=A0A5C6U952_9SPHN|nr:fasciclin domain-containing protein [Sphingorhabdus soli]